MIGKDTRILVREVGYKKVPFFSNPVETWTGSKLESYAIEPIQVDDCVKVRFINGVELISSADYKLAVRKKGNIRLADLDDECQLKINSDVFKFDYLSLTNTSYVHKLSSFDLGILIGIFYTLSADDKILDIPLVRKETWKALQYLLDILNVKYEKIDYYRRADRRKYEIQDEEFLAELQPLLVKDSIPEFFWESKQLLQGFLKVMFTFSVISPSLFSIRANRDTLILKDMQQALLLFGINSTYTKGFKMSQLLIIKNNRYHLVNRIGAFNAERFFEGVDFRKFLRYSDKDTIDTLYTKVYRVGKVEPQTLYKVSGQQLMANGVILENYE